MSNNDFRIERRRVRKSYITSTIIITLLLFLLGCIGLLLLNTQKISTYIKEHIKFEIFLKDGITMAERGEIESTLNQKPYVNEYRYITKEEALVIAREQLGEDILDVLEYNPLSPSLEVYFKEDYANPDSINIIESELRNIKDITEVFYQKDLVHEINDNMKKISFYVFAFCGILLLIAITLINNTIRLSIYSKRFIIRTMQLVGATPGYIRRPFLYRNVVYGIIGALLAILALLAIVYSIQKEYGEVIQLNDIIILTELFSAVLISGILITWVSTYFAVTKYLNMKTDKLYT
jgi:cell division transport system permease protein